MTTNDPQPGTGPATAAAVQPLEPPDQALTLEAPAAPAVVQESAAPRMAPAVAAEAMPVLDQKVDDYMSALTTAQPKSPEFAAQAENVRTMGDADIRKAAETSNRLLDRPVQALKKGGLSEGSEVGKTLLELRRTVEDLDPSHRPAPASCSASSPSATRSSTTSAATSPPRASSTASSTACATARTSCSATTSRSTWRRPTCGRRWAGSTSTSTSPSGSTPGSSAKIAELEVSDPETAKALNEDVLFYVRQKHQDLLTQLAVSIQSYLAIDIIIKNNIELIKGVDRASTTTISALRTAVIVAQALGNQKLVLDQITALNTTTSGMIERTSEMLKDNSAAIQEQAALVVDRHRAAAGGLRQHLRHAWTPSTSSS